MLIRSVCFSVVLLVCASPASSLVLEPLVTGADMSGMQVTAYYSAGSDSALWAVTSPGPGGPFGEGFAGAASGGGWSLSQQGYTFGNIARGVGVLGAWSLTNNTGSSITSLRIDALMANIVFDILDDAEHTPGSGLGRAFLPEDISLGATTVYSNQLSPGFDDLFGTLTINFANGFADGASLRFLADTDAVVPSPGSLWLFAIGFLGMCCRRLKCEQKSLGRG